MNNSNPFQTLKLSTQVTKEDIVARKQELSATAEPEEQELYRQATEQLIAHPLRRLEHELFEAPGTCYEDQEWERFMRLFRRKPVHPEFFDEVSVLGLDETNLSAFLQHLLDVMLSLPEGNQLDFDEVVRVITGDNTMLVSPESDLLGAITNPPFSLDRGPLLLEVHDVIF